MSKDLIVLRENAINRAYSIVDANWPARKGAQFRSDMIEVIDELKTIASGMKAQNYPRIEQSRIYRYLGSLYSDLIPELGIEMIQKSCEAYDIAENLLKDINDPLERAKLNFNYGNVLRQADSKDVTKLEDAKRRIKLAGETFLKLAPQFMPSVDEALKSIEALLKIAPVAQRVERNIKDTKEIEKRRKRGVSEKVLLQDWLKLKSRNGGISGLLSEVQNVIDGLPTDFKEDERFPEISKMLGRIYTISEGDVMPKDNDDKIFELLNKRLEKDVKSGKTKRSDQLKELLGSFKDIISSEDDSVGGHMKKIADMRGLVGNMLELAHYPSYGIPRPPEGTRAAELVELCWSIRRLLLEEANRRGKGADESSMITKLSIRATNIDKRIYKAGVDNSKARSVELDELRPLADQVRKFTLLRNAVLARPIWRATKLPVDTNSVFYSGLPEPLRLLTGVCKNLGLSILKAPKSTSFANARWKQLQKASLAVFNMGAADGPDRAAVAYELGIALTLGKPIVILTTGENLPFDVDIVPIDISEKEGAEVLLMKAIDESFVSFVPHEKVNPLPGTLQQVLKSYPLPQDNIYVDQSLKQLQRLGTEPDPVSTDHALKTLVGFLDKEPVMLIHPTWPPSYSDRESRLFHVMPFRPGWAADASKTARDCCKKLGVDYIRGDEVRDLDVIQSIWNEICQSSHVLVDLTGFNANVALELGISHTLGKPTLITGATKTVDNLFPMISKVRVSPYRSASSKKLAKAVEGFLLSVNTAH